MLCQCKDLLITHITEKCDSSFTCSWDHEEIDVHVQDDSTGYYEVVQLRTR